jgi:hypothetical protein
VKHSPPRAPAGAINGSHAVPTPVAGVHGFRAGDRGSRATAQLPIVVHQDRYPVRRHACTCPRAPVRACLLPGRPAGGPPSHTGRGAEEKLACLHSRVKLDRRRGLSAVILRAEKEGTPRGSLCETEMVAGAHARRESRRVLGRTSTTPPRGSQPATSKRCSPARRDEPWFGRTTRLPGHSELHIR